MILIAAIFLMTMNTDDRDARRREWDRSAPGWEAWFDTIERASRPVSDRLVDMAAVSPGDRILDIATGAGEPAITAARRVLPDGHVLATDISPSMIAAAQRRAAGLGITNATFRVQSLEELEAPSQSFDAVLCRWGLMFVPELDDALRRIRRVIHPGGRFAASAWADCTEVPVLSIEHDVLGQYFEDGHFAYGLDRLNAFRLSAPGLLESVMSTVGFGEVACERVCVVYEFPSADEYIRFRREVSSTADALAKRHPKPVVEAAWRALANAVAIRADPSGRIRMENTALCVVGTA